MSSPKVHLSKAISTESLHSRHETSQHRINLQHIFNSCVLDKNQRVNAGELVRHFRFVAEQNADLLTVQFDFAFLLNQLGGADQQVTFEQLFNAVEKLYNQLVDQPGMSTPLSKSISSMSYHSSSSSSSSKKRRNKENIDSHTSDDASANLLETRRKSHDHEKCKGDQNELLETNRRQTECLRMLEEEYRKLEDDHQRLQSQYEDIEKKRNSLEEELTRNSRYINENVDLHVYKTQLEDSYRELKEENECCEREKFELQEQMIDMESQLQAIRTERDQYLTNLMSNEHDLKTEAAYRQQWEEQCHQFEHQLKDSQQLICSLRTTIDELNLTNQGTIRKNLVLEKNIEELRQQLRNAKMESIEARLSLSNLCDEESFLCDELEERVDVSRRMTLSNGQSLFAEINTMDNISNECVSQCLDSSNMENIDDMEVQILLSKTDSFNSIYLKDLFHELHSNGMNINEHLLVLNEQIHCEQDRESLTTAATAIDKHICTIKNLIKKLIDNKDVFEGRFRKLQSLLIASREKQQKLQLELKEFSRSVPFELNSSNIATALKDYQQIVEELQCKEQLSDEKIRLLEDQLSKSKAEEKAQRLKCLFLTKQMKKLSSKTKEKREEIDDHVIALAKKTRIRRNFSNLTSGVCPFHSVQELLRDDQELFHSTSLLLPCRCLNRSRSTPALTDLKSSMTHFRRLSSPCSSTPSAATAVTTDSGLNTSTGCTTSRSPTPDLGDHVPSMTFELDSLFDRTLTKTMNSSKGNGKKRSHRSDRSLSTSSHGRSDRVKRVLKRLQWCAIITSCSIVLFLWSVIIRYYCLTSPNDDDCNRLSFAWWPFAYCSTNGITL